MCQNYPLASRVYYFDNSWNTECFALWVCVLNFLPITCWTLHLRLQLSRVIWTFSQSTPMTPGLWQTWPMVWTAPGMTYTCGWPRSHRAGCTWSHWALIIQWKLLWSEYGWVWINRTHLLNWSTHIKINMWDLYEMRYIAQSMTFTFGWSRSHGAEGTWSHWALTTLSRLL